VRTEKLSPPACPPQAWLTLETQRTQRKMRMAERFFIRIAVEIGGNSNAAQAADGGCGPI